MFWLGLGLGLLVTLSAEAIALVVAAVVKYNKRQRNLKVVDRTSWKNI